MKNFIENIIEIAANEAVKTAESAFGAKQGSLKKELAIELVTNALPVPSALKKIIARLLSKTIDKAIEFAVSKLKKIAKNEGE